MKFVDMKLDPEESKEESTEVQEQEGPAYPWGLCLYLDQAALDKLGMKMEDFKVGSEMALMAMVKVAGISLRERDGGESYSSVDLQVTEMGLGDEGEMPEEEAEKPKAKMTGDKLYGEG